MKFFALLMAFLVLALGAMPCADTDAMDQSQSATSIKAAHQQGQEHDDACPPFCQCSCCAGFSISPTVPLFATLVLFKATHTSAFLPSKVIAPAFPIWQPPKVRS